MGFFRDPDPDPEIPGIFKIPIPGIFFSKIPKSRNPGDRDGKFSGSRKNPERISKHIMHSQISQNPELFRKINLLIIGLKVQPQTEFTMGHECKYFMHATRAGVNIIR